jgi:phage major head subunit gpT-like protein
MDKITSRAVRGMLQQALTVNTGPAWIDAISNFFTSDQASEEYPWLSSTPAMREWVGGRNAKGFTENSLTIANKHYEATLEVLLKDLRRDKIDALRMRINELGRRAGTHWASLLSTLIINGEATACYDGHYFFDETHEEGDSGAQSNSITVDIADYPVETAGSVTLPAVAEFQFAIANAVEAIVSFVDDQGEPMNEDASQFLVMVPHAYMNVALQAVATPVQVAETQSALQALKQAFSISAMANPRLSTLAASHQFVVFRTDSYLKSFIRQQETTISYKEKAEGSDYEFDNDAHQYGIDVWRNVGYGFWQNSCLVTME